jgi:hypothetical protein
MNGFTHAMNDQADFGRSPWFFICFILRRWQGKR